MRCSVKLLVLMVLILTPCLSSSSSSSSSSLISQNHHVSKLTTSLLPPSPKQDVALVATLDGTVYLVDTNLGKIKWSFESGSPIYSSYQDNTDDDDDEEDRNVNASDSANDSYYVDCGDDWQLYVHSKNFGKLEKMSLSADEYIRRIPYVSENGEITLGSKNTTAFLVDAKTGRVVRTYRLDGSPLEFGVQGGNRNALVLPENTAGLLEPGGSDLGNYQNLIYVTRTDYMLQHFSPNSSKVLWKVSFADIEAEFRCQPSFSGVSLNGDMDADDDEWQLPCQMKTNVLRIRDNRLLEFDKLPVALLGDGSHSLPASIRASPLGPTKNIPLALPADKETPMLPDNGEKPLALPAPERNTGIMEISSLSSNINATPNIWSLFVTPHNWPVITTIVSIVGVVFYNYLALKKQRKSNEPGKLKLQSQGPKKKKGRRSGNKASPKRERQQKSPPRSEVADANGIPQVEESERKLLLTFPNQIDSHADGRQIGKLLVLNKEIAKGSNGTVVLEGIYDGRPVAVKRLVQTHHDVALKEIQNLIASDKHQNIVRWYGVEFDQDFVYLALERCTCSLSDLIYVYSDSFQNQTLPTIMDFNCLPEYTIRLPSLLERDGNVELWKANGYPSTQLLKLMRDVVAGLAHLHELGIIHRDLKPQNVLIINEKSLCAKLSDMGISKRLTGDLSSLTRQLTGYGSSGWQAPEQLLQGRQTRAVDLFSLGCVLFFCATGGKHPFGDSIERDLNILNGRKDLFLVENIPEAVDLFCSLLDPNPDKRPKAREVLSHPFFWSCEKRLLFLQDVSDRVELEDRETDSELLKALESTASMALNGKWDEKMEAAFINNIGHYRRYKYDSIRDLLRVIRNKSHHYRELPQEIKELLGSHPEGFEKHFSSRFPKLLIEVYKVIHERCKDEEFFRKYIESNVI